MRFRPLRLYVLTLVMAVCAMSARAASATFLAQSGESTNVWGGQHVRIELTETGANLDFDCATGSIDQPLVLPKEGKFQARGTYTQERGGPVRKDGNRVVAATYVGTIKGDAMHLEVVLANNNVPVGSYDLVRGSFGHVVKCR